jgi:hypothetical protein
MISLPSTSTRTMTDRRWRSLIAFRTVLLTAASWVGLADGPVPFVVAGAVPLFMPHTVSHALRSPRSRAGQSGPHYSDRRIAVAGRCHSLSHAGLVPLLGGSIGSGRMRSAQL